jgi:hypothetical protein
VEAAALGIFCLQGLPLRVKSEMVVGDRLKVVVSHLIAADATQGQGTDCVFANGLVAQWWYAGSAIP